MLLFSASNCKFVCVWLSTCHTRAWVDSYSNILKSNISNRLSERFRALERPCRTQIRTFSPDSLWDVVQPYNIYSVERSPVRLNPLMHKVAKRVTWNNGVWRHTGLTHCFLILTSGQSGAQAWATDRPHVKIKNHGLGQYGAKPHYSTLPFWQLCALKRRVNGALRMARSVSTTAAAELGVAVCSVV